MTSRFLRPALVVVAMLAVTLAGAGEGRAQGRLDARYSASIGGLPFGKGSYQIEVRDDQFTAVVSATTSGVIRIFTSGKGLSTVRGTVSGGQPSGQTYASSVSTDQKYDEVRMVMSGGTVKELAAEPPTMPHPERVPLTEAHRRGVSDPMTASLMRVPGSGDTFVPEACRRTLSIFDGRMRYDLQLSYKRLDKVKSEKGYQGTVVVCAVQFLPVAGYIPHRPIIKYLVDVRDAELWLAPLAGTRLMVPYRMSIPTPLGFGILQATEFVSIPQPSRPAVSGSRTQ
jgi:Protein of unknown function (DUF3108)